MKQVTLKRLKHPINEMLLPFQGDLLYFAFYPRRSYLICPAVLRFHLFSDAIAWQNAAYPGVPGRIPAESALV